MADKRTTQFLCDEIISRLERGADPADIGEQYASELNACMADLDINGEPFRVERDYGTRDSLYLTNPNGGVSLRLLATYKKNPSCRLPQGTADNREAMLVTIREWARFGENLPVA